MLCSVYRTYVRFGGQLYTPKSKRAFGKPNDSYRPHRRVTKISPGQDSGANPAAAVTAISTATPRKRARAMPNTMATTEIKTRTMTVARKAATKRMAKTRNSTKTMKMKKMTRRTKIIMRENEAIIRMPT
jgi:hypothetical protein